MLGDTGNDTLNGGDGNDTLYGDGRMGIDSHGAGTAGPITLYGDVERDIDSLTGLDGNDIINAGKGNDVIYGGRGNDIMSGGPGSDQFMIEARSGNDHITDFAHVDKIVFDALSGADDYSDLIFALVGKDTLITWGTGDSLTIDGLRPRELTSADFVFAPATATSATASLASVEPSFHSTDFAASHAGAELAGHALMLG